MDSNFWFYTLSTIPQTLGAIIGLFATFIIFRLNHMESRLKAEYDDIKEWIAALFDMKIHEITSFGDSEILQKLSDGIDKLDKDKEKLGFERYDWLSNLLDNRMRSSVIFGGYSSNEKLIFAYLSEKERIYKSLLDNKKNALNRLIYSLFFTAIPISISLIFLPLYGTGFCRFIPFISNYSDISCSSIIVVATILLSIGAIFYIAYNVYDIAHRSLR